MWALKYRRPDGTFVIQLPSGHGYHVVATDPLYPAVAKAADGVELPPEPPAVHQLPTPPG